MTDKMLQLSLKTTLRDGGRVLGGADIGGAVAAAGGKTWPSAAPAAAKSGQRLT